MTDDDKEIILYAGYTFKRDMRIIIESEKMSYNFRHHSEFKEDIKRGLLKEKSQHRWVYETWHEKANDKETTDKLADFYDKMMNIEQGNFDWQTPSDDPVVWIDK